MSRLTALLIVVVVALAVAMQASARPSVDLTIRHQVRGCHAWAVGTGPYKAAQSLHVAAGTALVVRNDDVMPHQLLEVSGPAVSLHNVASTMNMMGLKGSFGAGMMAQMGAGAELVLAKPGTYRFTTKPGEDYMQGVKTVGEDNVLTLTVVVS